METLISPYYSRLARLGLMIALPLILYLATMPQDHAPLSSWNDKVQHILAFATITLMMDASFPKSAAYRQ